VNYKDPQIAAMHAARAGEMAAIPEEEGGPYVSIDEAAAAAKVIRSNIYHWVRAGEIRRKNWGRGRGSVYVSLLDLQKKVPVAFGLAAAPAAPAEVKPARGKRRLVRAPKKRRAA